MKINEPVRVCEKIVEEFNGERFYKYVDKGTIQTNGSMASCQKNTTNAANATNAIAENFASAFACAAIVICCICVMVYKLRQNCAHRGPERSSDFQVQGKQTFSRLDINM